MRSLSVLSELRLSPDGRAIALNGVAFDMTDRDRPRWKHRREPRKRHAPCRATSCAVGVDGVRECPSEMAQSYGLDPHEISVDPFTMIVPKGQNARRDRPTGIRARETRFGALDGGGVAVARA